VTGVSVVVPVFNGERTLEELARRAGAALEGREHELVFVNDGSTDGSWRTIQALAAGSDRIRGLNLSRNYGQHNATLAGLRVARFPVTVTIDDDLQNPPEEIPLLLERLETADVDVVYGIPKARRHGFWRNVGTRFARMVMRAAVGGDLADKVSGFRAFRTELRESFAFFRGPYVIIDVLLSWSTSRYAAVEVRHDARAAGATTYSFGKLAGTALTWLTAFSIRPLRLASIVGLVTFVFGLGVLGAVLIAYATRGNPIPGFAFLASIIAIFSGAQLLTLGIMGEYVARVHVRVTERPAYDVREVVGAEAKAPQHAGS
jgi:glycosyltransferase involved in cell wall biosynthesis